MRTLLSLAVCVGLLTAACSENSQRHFAPPTAPTVVTSPTVPTPPPIPFPFSGAEVTTIEVGEVVQRRITEPPECVAFRGWPCQYFQLTTPTRGRLEVVLTYSPDTQPNRQGVDLSVRDFDGLDTWAGFFRAGETRVDLGVVAGKTYYITMWYTFPGLEYELRSSVQ